MKIQKTRNSRYHRSSYRLISSEDINISVFMVNRFEKPFYV